MRTKQDCIILYSGVHTCQGRVHAMADLLPQLPGLAWRCLRNGRGIRRTRHILSEAIRDVWAFAREDRGIARDLPY